MCNGCFTRFVHTIFPIDECAQNNAATNFTGDVHGAMVFMCLRSLSTSTNAAYSISQPPASLVVHSVFVRAFPINQCAQCNVTTEITGNAYGIYVRFPPRTFLGTHRAQF
jgi:hypothetical protein